jgi:hypothetical protein
MILSVVFSAFVKQFKFASNKQKLSYNFHSFNYLKSKIPFTVFTMPTKYVQTTMMGY